MSANIAILGTAGMLCHNIIPRLFFFNDPATTEIYTLSLHDALPILRREVIGGGVLMDLGPHLLDLMRWLRSEEHTSELQSHHDLVCRLLLEKKKEFHQRRAYAARVSKSTGLHTPFYRYLYRLGCTRS